MSTRSWRHPGSRQRDTEQRPPVPEVASREFEKVHSPAQCWCLEVFDADAFPDRALSMW